MEVYIGLGSNQGPSLDYLETAIAAFAEMASNLAVSSLYRTQAQDDPDQPDFWNAVIRLSTTRSAQELWQTCQIIERRLGRERDPLRPKGPRAIDVDLLLYGDAIIETNDLTLPHPRLHLRRFVLEPLVELDPRLIHPKTQKPLRSYLDLVADQGIYAQHPPSYNGPALWTIKSPKP